MLFKVKRGVFYQGNVTYKKGSIVDTDLDLCERFSKEKFERMHELERTRGTVSAKKPSIPPPVDKGKGDTTSEPLSTYGKDVTSEFPTAADVEVKVFRKNKAYTVVDLEDNGVLNEDKLRRKDVEPFLEQYLGEEDEDNAEVDS